MKKYGFGVDIGGTNLKFGFFDTEGNMLDSWSVPTDVSDNGAHILADIAGYVKEYIEKEGYAREQLLGVGLGVPGPVDGDGVVHRCVNLGWGVLNVETALTVLTGLPTRAGNDANVAALGEMWQGGGKGYRSAVMVTLGTGVGGGIIIDGKMLSGANGAGGEIGHMPVHKTEQRLCGCGKTNCLEVYTSGSGIAKSAKKALSEYAGETLLRKCADITAKEVFECAGHGDELALALVDEVGEILGEALANVACVCDPEVFVIGGGVSKAGEMLTETVRSHYRKYAFHACAGAEFKLAELGSDAGMYGSFRQLI